LAHGYGSLQEIAMLHAFVFGPIAITVGHWVQRGTITESGARVEIRRVEHDVIPGAADGVAGFRLLPASAGIWRADLFRTQDGEIIYHYHPHFEDGDVGERYFDDGLTADPVGWVSQQLGDVRRVLVDGGAGDIADDAALAEVQPLLPVIREAIERSFTSLGATPR
jgi:hypothetical protein